jgi:surfeit locus 1 family protein
MDAAPRRPRSRAALVLLVVAAALACAGFAALGVWQVQRLAWKEALIAHVDQAVHAEPTAAPGPGEWASLRRDTDEYRRVRIDGRFAFDREVLVRASTALGAGYWVLTPLRTPNRAWVLVNRGFIPPEQRERVPRGEEAQSIVGLLRFSEPGGGLLQHNEPASGRWYSRDVAAIAAARDLRGRVAPYFIDAQATPPTAAAWPRPGLTVIQFRNDHLVYAITWFALAAMVAAAIGYLVVDERRLRRAGAGSVGYPQS